MRAAIDRRSSATSTAMAFVTGTAGRLALGRGRVTVCGRRGGGAGQWGPRMLVVEAKGPADMDTILDAAKDALVVVDYSTTWCGPCKVIAPKFEAMSEEHTDVVFVKVMGDVGAEAGELMKREGIRAVPAFHFYKNQKRVHSFVGAKEDEIIATIAEYK